MMEEYKLYYDILIKNDFYVEDEYSHNGFSDNKINYLKFHLDDQNVFSSQRYVDTRLYFNYETGEVTSFQLHASNDLKDKINRELKIAIREYKINSIIED